jgi:hypothetical protein
MTVSSAAMTADPTVLDRIFDRLVRTLAAGGPDQLRAVFRVADIVHALVPYRTYRHELGVETLQDYEHAVLEMLAGARGWLICDEVVVERIRRELASPDPDTSMLRALEHVEVRMDAVRMPITLPERPVSAAEAGSVFDAAGMNDAPALPLVTEHSLAVAPEAAAIAPVAEPQANSESDSMPEIAHGVPDEQARPTVSDAPIDARHDESATTLASVPTVERPAPTPLPPLEGLTVTFRPEPPETTPLQSVHGVTVAQPGTLSRITPLSAPSVYGDPIEFRGVRHAPVDVGGVIFLFGMIARELGFTVEAMASGFPRCEAKRQLAPGKWTRVRIDFELESRHFRDAGRNHTACDLIVCWRDTWPDRPASLDILSLERVLPTLSARTAS